MRLVELKPHWLHRGEQRVGVMFLCPRCVAKKLRRPTYLTCFWVGQDKIWRDDDGQMSLVERALREKGLLGWAYKPNDVVPCKRGYAWQMSGGTFENLTLQPSLDASASGHWHGHVTNGEIVGGL